jgi:hypothetical protein
MIELLSYKSSPLTSTDKLSLWKLTAAIAWTRNQMKDIWLGFKVRHWKDKFNKIRMKLCLVSLA